MAQETVLLLAVSGLALVFLVQGLLTALDLAKEKARAKALETELVRVRSELVLAKAREWEFHRESGKHQGMD
jgi:ubiquitin C-terminal hydrolase